MRKKFEANTHSHTPKTIFANIDCWISLKSLNCIQLEICNNRESCPTSELQFCAYYGAHFIDIQPQARMKRKWASSYKRAFCWWNWWTCFLSICVFHFSCENMKIKHDTGRQRLWRMVARSVPGLKTKHVTHEQAGPIYQDHNSSLKEWKSILRNWPLTCYAYMCYA